MKIAELFYSIQGEGKLTGVPSVFIRTTGCNLRCRFCDTPYTSWQPEGEHISLSTILERISRFPTRHVVVTGGEPMIAGEIETLCADLRGRDFHITIETAGTVFKPVACDLMSISPKLSNSTPHEREGGRFALRHDHLRDRPDVVRSLMELCEYQLKFVVDRPEDLAEIGAWLARLPEIDPSRVLLMPMGISREDLQHRALWLVGACKERGFRYCPRLHIELWGNMRGT